MTLISPDDGDRGAKPARLAGYLQRIEAGEGAARDELLEAYAPFAMSVASRIVGRYVRLGHDDEANVALIALDEAVRTFEAEKGSFLGFAAQVIRRRIIDQVRRDSRRAREIPAGVRLFLGEVDAEEGFDRRLPLDSLVSEFVAREHEESEARRQELAAFARELAYYALDLEELAHVAPRHRDARESAKGVARLLADDRTLREHLVQRRQLPLRELELRSGVGRKSLERQRKYIIAVAIILMGDYEHLLDYVNGGS